MRKITALLLSMIFAVTALAVTAFADGANSITLRFYAKNEGLPFVNATFYLYCVAEPVGAGGYELTEDFRKYPIDLEKVDPNDAGAMTDYCGALSAFAAINADPVQTNVTDGKGYLTFGELPDGLYLVRGEPVILHEGTENQVTYIPQPVLIFLPYLNEDGTISQNVKIDIKYTRHPPEGQGETIELTVIKVWEDDGYHPNSVTAQLVRNGEVYDEAQLNVGNNWKYTWKDLDAAFQWQIVEKNVPEGYVIYVSQDGYEFSITNTDTSPANSPVDPPPSDPPVKPPVEPTDPPGDGPSDNPPGKPSDEHQPLEPSASPAGGDEEELPEDIPDDELPDEPSEPTPEETPEDISGTDTTPEPALPQTGQLWWPVPVLFGIGIPLSGAGMILRKKEREDSEKQEDDE